MRYHQGKHWPRGRSHRPLNWNGIRGPWARNVSASMSMGVGGQGGNCPPTSALPTHFLKWVVHPASLSPHFLGCIFSPKIGQAVQGRICSRVGLQLYAPKYQEIASLRHSSPQSPICFNMDVRCSVRACPLGPQGYQLTDAFSKSKRYHRQRCDELTQ